MKLQKHPIIRENLLQIIDFLKKDEKTCITLMSRFIKQGDIELLPNHIKGYSFYLDKEVVGVLAISDGGIVLHHFRNDILVEENPIFAELKEIVLQILLSHNIYSIIGDMKGTDFLRKSLENERQPKIIIPYTLMLFNERQNKKQPLLPENFSLKKCTSQDTEALYPLQAAYDIVEVLPPGEVFNPDNCRLNLHHNLANQYILGLFSDTEKVFVAKAGTNAIGLNWVQLGGVFTKEDFRGRGFASFLVKTLGKRMTEKNKKIALFVKDSNDFAKKAYIRAGFEPDSKFCICYY